MFSNCVENNIRNNNDENDLFYFESEHLALRGNKDYSELLKTIAILEAQRAGAIKDIDQIIQVQKIALEDPVSFVEKIKNGKDLGIPCPQRIADIPVINWSKYNTHIPKEAFKLINQEKIDDINKLPVKEPKKPKFENHHDTFNKPWTSEEQKRLEELLVQFPPEAVEMRRYKKIADALGNRTVKQVTSRVQKYFLKLYKAGLPIPGRIPKITDKKKSYIHKHQKHNAYLYKPSTFFPDLEVPVFMTDNDDDESTSCAVQIQQPVEHCNINNDKSELEIKINLLKKVKAEKEKDGQPVVHLGFKCDKCHEEPIVGSRWHCHDCTHDSVDFCTDCMISQVQNRSDHPLTHNLQPVIDVDADMESAKPSETDADASDTETESQSTSSSSDESEDTSVTKYNHYDQDYVHKNTIYNYLDPNFLPE